MPSSEELISARFMRQDPFEFTPEFKLVIAGNHLLIRASQRLRIVRSEGIHNWL